MLVAPPSSCAVSRLLENRSGRSSLSHFTKSIGVHAHNALRGIDEHATYAGAYHPHQVVVAKMRSRGVVIWVPERDGNGPKPGINSAATEGIHRSGRTMD